MELKEKDLSFLTTHFLFAGLDKELIRKVSEAGKIYAKTYRTGEVIHSPSSEEPLAGMVISGKATVTTPDPVRKTLMRFLHAGDLFGVANLFTSSPYISLIRAEGSCRCVCFKEEAIKTFIDESPVFRERYIAFLSGRIRFLNRKIGYLTAGCAERRLSLYLVSLGEGTVELKDSISSLSELLNLGRASLYRAFDRLCEDGYLQKDGKKLTIPDPEGMLNAYCS